MEEGQLSYGVGIEFKSEQAYGDGKILEEKLCEDDRSSLHFQMLPDKKKMEVTDNQFEPRMPIESRWDQSTFEDEEMKLLMQADASCMREPRKKSQVKKQRHIEQVSRGASYNGDGSSSRKRKHSNNLENN